MGKLKKALTKKRKELQETRKALRQGKRVPIQNLSEYLRRFPPNSEKWFHSRWKAAGMLDFQDLFNRSLGPFIPDCRNSKFKYVIEVDGSVHSGDRSKAMDARKDRFFSNLGYRVFRLRAFDEGQFETVVSEVKLIRSASRSRKTGGDTTIHPRSASSRAQDLQTDRSSCGADRSNCEATDISPLVSCLPAARSAGSAPGEGRC